MNYYGMYNWTNDLPLGSRDIFLKYLRLYNKPKILEIGTYVGTSLITMLNVLPESTAIAIDNWDLVENEFDGCRNECRKNNMMEPQKDSIKDIFKSNIKPFNDRVKYFEGDSCNILRQLNRDQYHTFDIIYVDGSHKCLDVLVDIILAWELLNVGGMMILDDYEWNMHQPDPFGRPEYAINHFLDKYKKEMRILDIDYRVFIQKL